MKQPTNTTTPPRRKIKETKNCHRTYSPEEKKTTRTQNMLHRKKIDPWKGDEPNLESQPLVFDGFCEGVFPPQNAPAANSKKNPSSHIYIYIYIFHRISSEAAMSCGNFQMKGQRHVICH